MPNHEGKERITVTLDKPLVQRLDALTDNRSDFVNKVLTSYLETYDEQFDQKLQKDLEALQAKISEREAKKKQMLQDAETKKRLSESKMAEALKEIGTLKLDYLMDNQVSNEVKKIAAKQGFDWENNVPFMDALMKRVWERKEELGRKDW